jgi:hypothetical protein
MYSTGGGACKTEGKENHFMLNFNSTTSAVVSLGFAVEKVSQGVAFTTQTIFDASMAFSLLGLGLTAAGALLEKPGLNTNGFTDGALMATVVSSTVAALSYQGNGVATKVQALGRCLQAPERSVFKCLEDAH